MEMVEPKDGHVKHVDQLGQEISPEDEAKEGVLWLGEFKNESGIFRLSDPCFGKDIWCAGETKAQVGAWQGYAVKKEMGDWGSRSISLYAFHESVNSRVFYDNVEMWVKDYDGWDELQFEVGVESGQAGIFDDLYYNEPYSSNVTLLGGHNHELHWIDQHIAETEKVVAVFDDINVYDIPSSVRDLVRIHKNHLTVLKRNKELLQAAPPKESKEWYDVCCALTLSDMCAGVLPEGRGVLSSSGYGDGGYTAYRLVNTSGEAVGVKIKFLDHQEDPEEE